ncbi:bifunctional [glutamate--ammonia ligase]-adenylyl-L-tyrosine phosphorylase/[glutamate--ammonia-ligase] adenylyltransferase [Erythrobacter sp.]|uniref:bifunctional [glutamate--ammonia ligase]-adenylyl-L-tyrosine phosphorylase/[glutamate--ammonia-ligase] adenylyltransferase n=1 Tax=Erythrobacter sp. TaxID=1042 RepID=UPI001425CBF8|nr:bifunctional [glutamate--ammonia ligase]-adenylyl-L-tyrosine phosphorylase/[glutamate--ammonia-ligase] adenylyltransferase [Erythrobacter sp.]QIQ87356.1 MAG: bifunctional [glutamate--ammonia ligase]-adenylyl-L-tyrosine phosphorylase/[glutamate--ammonia-ligase] adenylyltransferase [Erythrobacter sp.]
MAPTPDWTGALERARAHAPFLARALDRQEELAAMLAAGEGEAALERARALGESEDVEPALRRERLALATALAIGDLAGAFPLARVTGELTAFADRALDRAIRAAIRERTGEDSADGFVALALGKQGAGELNYSSDIDPILLFDPDRLPRRERDDPGEAAQRYARRIVRLLSETTAEGYVMRVDLRLRPASEISPPAVPIASALAHYQGQALAWERAAFVRARPAAGDIAMGEDFLAATRPFVWRRHLDFGAVAEIRRLTKRIREEHEGPPRPGPGFDVKRGRGGIREIEFYAQTLQLIHGGRDPSLRVLGTREALDALAAAGHVGVDEARVLGEGYDRLRVVEHRLQMVHDRQTHTLPESGEALGAVARLDGLADGAALVEELTELTARTGAIYEALIREDTPPAPSPPPAPPAAEEAADPDERAERAAALGERMEGWRDGRYQSLRSPQALAAFDAIAPTLAEAFLAADDPERALVRWESVLDRASSAINLFHLLKARPDLLERLISALTLAPVLADELARRPELLDILLDREAPAVPRAVEAIMGRIAAAAAREDYEALLDAIRVVTGEIRFALGVQLVEGEADPLDVAASLSRTAEAALRLAHAATAAEFERAHGRIAGSELLVLGLGRFGGGALTHASDLDIVYLFTGDFAAQSDGKRPLGATHYFNRLASRVSAALSVPTAEGALYEIDTRLRPQGAQGPLAVSCEAFAKYQREAAWTWEHMALARARVLVASDEARAEVEALIADVLFRPRDPGDLRESVLEMRDTMARHKPAGGVLDVKLLRGGLVDFEFLVHYLQLKGGRALADASPQAFSADLGTAIPALVEAGLLPEGFREDYDLMTRLLVAGRLLAPGGIEPPPLAARALARACRTQDYASLLRALGQARQRVARTWHAILGQDITNQQGT